MGMILFTPKKRNVVTPKNYGALYNWYAASNPLIAEGDFSVPESTDWQTLSDYLGDDETSGGLLKEQGLIHWDEPNEGALNSVNFKLLGNGLRNGSPEEELKGVFYALKSASSNWCSDDDELGNGYYVSVGNDTPSIGIAGVIYNTMGCGIRLFRLATESELLLADGEYCNDYIDYDLNHYKTVKIGTQVWMASNLKTTHYSDGSLIPLIEDNTAWAALTTGARCSYNNDDSNL